MNVQGFVLVLITAIIVVAMIIVNKWIRKVTNCYFFWAGIGLFFFIWLLIFRFIPDWQQYFTQEHTDIIISRAWLLDACPFFGLATCVVCFADPTRKIARTISPIALVGGVITIMSLIGDDEATLTAQYIFFGDEINRCYFIMHFLQIVIPIGIMLNTPRFGWKGWVGTFAVAVTYYVYVAIVAYGITGCRAYISGMGTYDWSPEGEYYVVHDIFDFIPIKAMPFIGIPFLFIAASIFIALNDYVFSRWHWSYGNAYSGKWYMWYNYNKHVPQYLI